MLFNKITKTGRPSGGLLASCLIWLIAGCTTANYTQRIDSFRQAANSAAVCISAYYISLNDFERKLYLDEIALDPEKDVLREDADGPTALAGGKFTAVSIKARTDALTLIGLYAQRLSDIAGSDAPAQFSNNVQALGASLTGLDDTFSKINSAHDATAKTYVAPITSLISSIGRLYITQRREEAVAEAIKNGAPKIRDILNLLESDLKNVIEPLQTTGLAEELAVKINFYNNHRKSKSDDGFSSLEKRRIALADIGAAAAMIESAHAFSPTRVLQSFRDAHEKLIIYANSPKDPKTFQEYITSLNALLQNTNEIATQIATLDKIMG